MKKNTLLFLSLTVICSLAACHTNKTSSIAPADSSILSSEPASVIPSSSQEQPPSSSNLTSLPSNTDIEVNRVEDDYTVDGEANLSDNLLLNHRFISVPVDGSDTIRGIERANQSGKDLVFKSNNTAIATVNENGVVSGVAQGTTTIEVSVKNHPEIKKVLDVRVYPSITGRPADAVVKRLNAIDENGLREIVDHELYEKKIYKNGVLQMYSAWDQNLVCSYDEAYLSITETDGDTKTENGAMTFKDLQWVFHTNEYYDTYTFHKQGDVRTYYPVSMVSYMDEGKARYVPMFEILNNLFTSGSGLFTNTIENAKLSGVTEYAMKNYNNVTKGFMGSLGDTSFYFECIVNYNDDTADQDDESHYGIPFGTPIPTQYNLKFTVEDGKVVGYSNHGIQTYTIGEDSYVEVYDIDHTYERITDENRGNFIVIPDKSQYTLVDYLFAI